jgi:NAD(P)H-dependent flavin oxidoreductase YrpB (nitropropane dioxygenase family)
METRFTKLVGCTAPIQVAPMGTLTTPSLAGEVVTAGGHAAFGATGMPAAELEGLLPAYEQACGRMFAVNFLVPFLGGQFQETFDLAASRAPMVDLYHAEPRKDLVDRAHAGGALVAWQITSAAEAVAAQEAGCDMIVAHGIEAGGRMPGGIGLLPLLQQVLDRVSIPVLAAGGLATPRGLAAVLAAGADGARLGTRFLTSAESGGHPDYVQAVLAAGSEDTTVSNAFSVLWPDGTTPPHRVLRSAVETAQSLSDDFVGEMQAGPTKVPLPRLSVPPPGRATTGRIDAMALYAGESAGAIDEVLPAGEIVRGLMQGAEELLSRTVTSATA